MRSGRFIPHFAVALNPTAKEKEETFVGAGARRPPSLRVMRRFIRSRDAAGRPSL
jgi:hypothetical protein